MQMRSTTQPPICEWVIWHMSLAHMHTNSHTSRAKSKTNTQAHTHETPTPLRLRRQRKTKCHTSHIPTRKEKNNRETTSGKRRRAANPRASTQRSTQLHISHHISCCGGCRKCVCKKYCNIIHASRTRRDLKRRRQIPQSQNYDKIPNRGAPFL